MSTLVGATLLDRYFLRAAVGSGGMADVYLAWDRLRSTKMAIKVLRRRLVEDPRAFSMFTKEAEYLSRLEHPNIVRLYEFEKDGDILFLVMDWIDGSNLHQALSQRRNPMTLEEAANILQPVSSALHYAHQNQVFHCDVKPQNILLSNDGKVLLSDFGVARLVSERTGAGTPPYMSPEQFTGGSVSTQSDIYSLGITLYEMLSGGKVPFRGDSPSSVGSTTWERIGWEHQYLPLPDLRNINPDLPQAVLAVVAVALSKDPKQRYPTVMELREAFERARMESGIGTGAAQRSEKSVQPASGPVRPAAHPKPVSAPGQKPAPKPQRKAVLPPKTVATPQDQQIVRPFRKPNIKQKGERASPGIGVQAPPQGSARYYLFGLAGERMAQWIPITKSGLVIGRGKEAGLQMNEMSVSRQHASILVTRRGVYLKDENSSLGTFLNNQRISGPVRLKHGDRIQIGYYQVFEFRER